MQGALNVVVDQKRAEVRKGAREKGEETQLYRECPIIRVRGVR